MEKTLKIGVLGAGRGLSLANGAKANAMQIVAVCDTYEDLAKRTAQRLDCQYYTDYGKMLDSDIDAVIVANYATEHVWAVKQALAADKHVLSECMACFTMAEAVELVEAVEASKKVYYFAENYPFFVQNLEMKRIYESGRLGKFVYGEGEYIHPISAVQMANLYSGEQHWRAWLAATYYCTHSMGPIINITGAMPVKVNAFVFPYDYDDPQHTLSLRQGDCGSVLMCRMDNEAVVKIIPWASLRDHGQRYRICCNRGTMEYNQGEARLRVHQEPYDTDDASILNQWYTPSLPAEYAEAKQHGHGGGDYFTSYYFAKAIREGGTPLIDVYKAVAMTMIGIQGYRSALDNSNTYEIPDLRLPEMREKYRHDDWNNDPNRPCANKPASSIRGKITPSAEARELFQRERATVEEQIRQEAQKQP